MFKRILIGIGITLAGVGTLPAARAQTPNVTPQSASQYRSVLERYCVTCHNERLRTAELVLSTMDVGNLREDPAVWEKVVRKLRTGAMPPAGVPRPDQATYDSFAEYLETEIDRLAAANPNPGRPAVHRLNRVEYSNAIRDLLVVDIDAGSLIPADDSGHGFDNIGDVLTVSPSLLDRYLSAARKIARLAIGDPNIRPYVEEYTVPRSLKQDARMSEDLPFGSRGGVTVRHYFPLDGEYEIKIRLQREAEGDILGSLAELHRVDVRLDEARIKLFQIGRERAEESRDPGKEAYNRTADSSLEIRVPVKAGSRLVGVTFVKDTLQAEGLSQFIRLDDRMPYVGSVIISGPYNPTGPGETASRNKIFVCRPTITNDEICARRILSTLARRAYRRPVTDEEVQELINLYRTGGTEGGFEAGIAMTLQGILVSPDFLFRVERDPANVEPDTAYRISDLELASRLSFFLWSSIPDDELLDLAERGQLKDPAVLESQVRRMLADSRSKALVSNFVGQWLYLRNLRTARPDPKEFPEFDENVRQALEQEMTLFLESMMLREDRSVVDLLDADYTFLNDRLARFYQIPNIYGSQFRRVELADENRIGLLGKGSVLMVTSYPTRTAPTLRGKWILENILGAPPPPPPPNVPSLKDDQDVKALTMRERMEQHRANPACATCHKVMDPLGFALENFDAIGRFRTTMGAESTPIDVSGVLPDGTRFEGIAGLREVLLSHPEQFVTTATEKLLIYALGRGLEYSDFPAIRKIVREAAFSTGGPASRPYRWSAIILGIVQSTPFQMRKSAEPATAAALRESEPRR